MLDGTTSGNDFVKADALIEGYDFVEVYTQKNNLYAGTYLDIPNKSFLYHGDGPEVFWIDNYYASPITDTF